MKDWALKWVKKMQSIPVEDKTETIIPPAEKTCKNGGHDYGRIKQWILPTGKVVHKRKCRRCQEVED